jgi:hypothetical protein
VTRMFYKKGIALWMNHFTNWLDYYGIVVTVHTTVTEGIKIFFYMWFGSSFVDLKT